MTNDKDGRFSALLLEDALRMLSAAAALPGGSSPLSCVHALLRAGCQFACLGFAPLLRGVCCCLASREGHVRHASCLAD